MDIESYKALSQVIVHDTLSVVKHLQKELAKEKRAHTLTTIVVKGVPVNNGIYIAEKYSL